MQFAFFFFFLHTKHDIVDDYLRKVGGIMKYSRFSVGFWLSWNVNLYCRVSVEWRNGICGIIGWFWNCSLFSYVDKSDGFNVGIKWLELLSFALLCFVNVHKLATVMTELCCWCEWSHDFSISPVSLNVTCTWHWFLVVAVVIDKSGASCTT
jgi:hypothetical protein